MFTYELHTELATYIFHISAGVKQIVSLTLSNPPSLFHGSGWYIYIREESEEHTVLVLLHTRAYGSDHSYYDSRGWHAMEALEHITAFMLLSWIYVFSLKYHAILSWLWLRSKANININIILDKQRRINKKNSNKNN